MKITQSDLEGAEVHSAVSSGKTFAVNEDKSACHIDQEHKDVLVAHGSIYVEKQGWMVADTIRAALTGRAAGEKLLSPREADVAARQSLDLNSPFLLATLMTDLHCYLMEGQPGKGPDGKNGNDLWYYRRRWNNGVKWRQEYKADSPEDTTKKAEALLLSIEDVINNQFNLPLWPEERRIGFVDALLKPEYLTWGQFDEERKCPKILRKPKI